VRNFRALQEFLETRYPEFSGKVAGGNYPAPPYAIMAVQLAGLLQWGLIALMFAGSSIFSTLGMAEPDWYKSMLENKMSAFIMVFFVNSMAQSMTATGAFEVAVDGVVIYSKLATGRMPNAGELARALEQHGFVSALE
jgi:selT/selW/selH-like putative selenoprotein